MEVTSAHLEQSDCLASLIRRLCRLRRLEKYLHSVCNLPVEYFLHLVQRVQTRLGFFALQPVHKSIVGITVIEKELLNERFQDSARTDDYLGQSQAFGSFVTDMSIECVADSLCDRRNVNQRLLRRVHKVVAEYAVVCGQKGICCCRGRGAKGRSGSGALSSQLIAVMGLNSSLEA